MCNIYIATRIYSDSDSDGKCFDGKPMALVNVPLSYMISKQITNRNWIML